MTEEKTLGEIGHEAYLLRYDAILGVPFNPSKEKLASCWEAAASAVREKVIEECAKIAFAQKSTEGEAIAQELLGKICVVRGHRYGQLIGGLLDGMLICNDCAAVLEASAPSQGDRTALPQDQRELETNLIHPHPRQDGQQCDHPIAEEVKHGQ